MRLRCIQPGHLTVALACVLAALGPLAASAQQAAGRIGFSLQVQADGFFNPKVVRAVVKSVDAGSPAQAAGLAPGDELVRVEGIAVPGAEASALKPHMEFEVGKPKKLAFRKPDGREYEATLVKQ